MSPHRSSAVRRWRARLLWWAGIGLAILIWYWAALDQPEYALPGPESTWHAFLGLIDDGDLGWTLWLTLSRAVIGLGLACLIGIPTGWALGTWTWLRELLDSWVQVLMAVPPIVLVVVGMIWLGPTAGVVILVVTLITLPLLVASMRDAVLNVDGDLLEMATVFSKSRRLTGWSPQIHTGFLVSRATQDTAKNNESYSYRAFTLSRSIFHYDSDSIHHLISQSYNPYIA